MDKFIKVLRLILISFIFIWVVIWYTGRALQKPRNSRNLIESSVVSLYIAPGKVKRYIKSLSAEDHLEKSVDPNDGAHQIGKLQNYSNLYDSIYLLHYRYLGNETGVVILQNIKNGDVAYTWDIPLVEIMKDNKSLIEQLSDKYMQGVTAVDHSLLVKKNVSAINVRAPIIASDTSLIFHSGNGYLYKIDKNSSIIWKIEKIFHHSIEFDDQGNIWSCSIDIENALANSYNFRDDAILCVQPDGEVKHFLSLSQIFSNNKLFENLIVSSPIYKWVFGLDPFHLNDIQPVFSDGQYWKKGDIFFSLCAQNMVVLYRPGSDSIIWYRKGPWRLQHDINIVNDSMISLYNNNALHLEMLKFTNNIAYYNFSNGQITTLAEGLFSSRYEGRQIQIFNNDFIIEETNNSTYLVLDSTGNLKCKFYIPYFSDFTHAQYPCWGRIYVKSDNQFIRQ